jgi:hypothetical protein
VHLFLSLPLSLSNKSYYLPPSPPSVILSRSSFSSSSSVCINELLHCWVHSTAIAIPCITEDRRAPSLSFRKLYAPPVII